ncbi:hypothetical protein RO3G_05118 [Lichtheimia corymbifera JMRC:FSU:9682]|uniref:MIR domain-containing protein n=1 Tax=Lichtheimia corymbifera JMRC:FSU:9682 TaxID=1263082 RepID=A0A068RP51_9FUNG|nr:hypothetical protein RO3G_05118 [Lichtheimia corymbifera JMRC:FSU:9682]
MSDEERDFEEQQEEEEQEEQQEEYETGNRPENNVVRYGDAICLKHDATGKFLTSKEEGYSHDGTSGQQIVFTNDYEDDESQEWLVLPVAGTDQELGGEVGFDDEFKLKHKETGRYLHSHPDIPSPVTGQQEVTGFGGDDETDENDIWVLQAFPDHEYPEEDYLWHLDIPLVIRHKMTGQTLHSHDEEFGDGNEVTGYVGTDDNDKWIVAFE